MALAATQHHSAPKSAGPETYEALRGQKTAKAGRRPGVLTEPEPQGGAVTVGYVAAPASPGGGVTGWRRRGWRHHRLLPPEGCAREEEEEGGERKVQERKERVMQEIHRKARADEAVTDVEWAAWQAWQEEEAVAEVLRSTSSSFRNSHSEIWTLFYEPFVLAVSCSVSWCCLVQQWIQSLCQFSEALVFFLIFYVLDSDPEVVPESGHSSTHPWYLAATGSVFALPGIYRKIGFSARRLQSLFPTSPLYLAVTLLCLVWIFREMTPGMVSVLNTPRFDSGHIGVSLRCLLEEFPSYFYAMLGSTVDTSLCVRLRRLVFLVTMHTSRCTPSLSSGPRCLSSRPVWTRRNVMCGRAENCGFSAVAVPRRSCSSSCRCAVAVSHGPDCWTKRFPSCWIRWSTSLLCRTREFHMCRRGEDRRAPTVALSWLPSWGAAHQRVDELMGWVFSALRTGAGPGVVSTGTRPP